jgi:NADH:ubiquinone oxidoreductase subunit 6 (subunit J)
MTVTPRPDSWSLPLFLHVFGAIVLVGAIASAALATQVSGRMATLRGLPFRVLVAAAIPAWLLMRFAGQWIDSKEDVRGDPTWLDVGSSVGDLGVVVLVVATATAWWSAKRPERTWPRRTVAVLSLVYLAALAVAWWAMTTKPGA